MKPSIPTGNNTPGKLNPFYSFFASQTSSWGPFHKAYVTLRVRILHGKQIVGSYVFVVPRVLCETGPLAHLPEALLIFRKIYTTKRNDTFPLLPRQRNAHSSGRHGNYEFVT